MKVTVVRGGRSSGEQYASLDQAALEQELVRQGERDNVPLLAAFGNILRQEIPDTYLAALPFAQQVAYLRQAGQFVCQRDGDIKVSLLPLAVPGNYFFFSNSPDANHIFSSIQEFFHRRSLHFRVVCHPILSVVREAGELKSVAEGIAELEQESFVWLELEQLPKRLVPDLQAGVEKILAAALTVSRDRLAILAKLAKLAELENLKKFKDLFEWLQDDNFVAVASRSYQTEPSNPPYVLAELPEEALGLDMFYRQPFDVAVEASPLVAPAVHLMHTQDVDVSLEKTALRCPLHRFENLSYLGFWQRLADGSFREHSFWGFYTQKSIDMNSSSIPALRKRIETAQQQLGIPHYSHNYRKTIQIINSFPKVELFLMGDDELRRMLRSFTQMHRQAGVKVVVAPSLSESDLTLLLTMPKEYYSVDKISRVESYIKRYVHAVAVESRLIHLSSDYLSLHVNLRLNRDEAYVDVQQLEQGLTRLTLPWELKFRDLLEKFYAADSFDIWEDYINTFDRDYQARTHPRFAVRDVRNIEQLIREKQDLFDLWGPFYEAEEFYRLQYYSLRESYLNDLMPFMENLDLCVIEEVDFSLKVYGQNVYIKSFAVRPDAVGEVPFKELKDGLIEALRAMSKKEVENDYLHRLLLLTGLSWREIDVFRGYRNYYFQLGCPFTKKRVALALIHNSKAALLLYRYFEGRFKPNDKWSDPMTRELDVLSPIRQQLVEVLEEVSDTNEDRILRTLFNLIDSTVRTNFYIRYQQNDYFLSFKVSSLGVIDMPAPRPLYEVYVHSATMEGLHLRGGKVARGGIRWSDRPDDFRTEVLGLVKAQMTKNAVIVPVGSKGGFVTKRTSSDREKMGGIVTQAYQTLMRGLLDLTDNRTSTGVVRPNNVIAYDDEDPYLVVAADKGTAHLSDTANAVSNDYGFWLGDAFASGGSHGYDHKKLGITARGAWESVKRLFREMGHNIQEEPFTVVGIGDMSGDVFGNGMLLSRKIKLLAAFNHMHIFLDPNPDPEVSFAERERLFNLSRSTWENYNPELISTGGGVFSRSLKEIPLSPQVADWLGIRQKSIDVPGLIQLLLKAEVDLLWNGGIGTYVKSSAETNENAGDRANDTVRIDGVELRAKVVGEGGNLGMTQLGRVEYSGCGGRLNTDAIDNSGGVDSSDHEVNLKILLQVLRHDGLLKTSEEGYRLLEEMEGTVCQNVLANNYTQTLSISLDEIRCKTDVEPYLELIDRLGRSGLLDRRGEFLPSRKEVAARAGSNLFRPELSVLLAYSKMFLYRALLDTKMGDNRIVRQLLFDYFPRQAVERYADSICRHPLANEIAATMLTNRVIDQAGSSFCQTLSRLTGRGQVTVANFYLVYDHLLAGGKMRQAVHAMDNKLPSEQQYQLLIRLENTLFSFCEFALSNGIALPQTEQDLGEINLKLQEYSELLPEILPADVWQSCLDEKARLLKAGFGEEMAQGFATLDLFSDFLPLSCMVEVSGLDLKQLAKIKVQVDRVLFRTAIIKLIEQVPVRDRWDRRAKEALLGSLHSVMVRIVRQVALDTGDNPQRFFAQRRQKLLSFEGLRQSLVSEPPRNFHPFSVLLRTLDNFLAG